MYLPERIRAIPIQSLFIGVLLAMVGILSLSFLAFQLIAQRVQRIEFDPTFDKFDELQLESARTAFLRRGEVGLRDYLASLDRIFGGSHYLLDAAGKDVITGTS